MLKVKECFTEPVINLKTAVLERKARSNDIACMSEEGSMVNMHKEDCFEL